MVKDCPRCGMVNPPEALRCDCGYDFASKQLKKSYLNSNEVKDFESPSTFELIICVILPVIGLILAFVAKGQGRRKAGNTMLAVACVVIAVAIGIRVLVALVMANQ